MMGIYPIGSIVALESGELGIVVEYPDESRQDEPLVMLLASDGSGGYVRSDEAVLANLCAQGDASDRYIVNGIPASRLGIEPIQLLMQEASPS
jgi:hypothetical protein